MKKIIVIGCMGSGKSTFAEKLHRKTKIPLFHLDNIWWKADRTHISREEFDSELNRIMQGDSWIIDGDYNRTYAVRFEKCDTVIFLITVRNSAWRAFVHGSERFARICRGSKTNSARSLLSL